MNGIEIPARVINGDFAGWLRDAMLARGMSGRMVALRTGINHSTITRLVYGYREPTLTALLALLRLFEDVPSAEWRPGRPEATARPDLSLL